MKVKIIKCRNNYMWYAERIGEIFDVLETNDKEGWYIVMKGKLTDAFIRFSDCEIVDTNN